MGSRIGLNPKIRGPKGVGFGRALPAPFKFGNGVFMDGNNDTFTIPNMVGHTLSGELTIESYFKGVSSDLCLLEVFFASGGTLEVSYSNSGTECSIMIPNTSLINLGIAATLMHGILTISNNANRVWCYYNGGALQGGGTNDLGAVATNLYNYSTSALMTAFILGTRNTGSHQSGAMDELRIYRTALRPDQVATNWNLGNGNNPCDTEHLIGWYQFEQFETLDFSAAQDGSNMQLGIRDMSGKFNHLLPHNMDTNPASPTYVLKPF